ncbi:MAG: terminase [Gammaproteobacteria bacterium]|nr:terminase [Gammaproteobacteria bacterium]
MPAPKGNKYAKGNPGGGRPTLYNADNVRLAYHVALLGATDVELANVLQVSVTTIETWKRRHKEFSEALRRGKMIADAKVVEALRNRALGYSHRKRRSSTTTARSWAETTKHYPPETAAASLWLRNRQPDKWRDKPVPQAKSADDPIVVIVRFGDGRQD